MDNKEKFCPLMSGIFPIPGKFQIELTTIIGKCQQEKCKFWKDDLLQEEHCKISLALDHFLEMKNNTKQMPMENILATN